MHWSLCAVHGVTRRCYLSQQGVDLVLGVPESVLDLAALLMSDNRNAIIKVSAAVGFIVPSLQL